MDFFQAQDHARRSSRRLIVYFLLAVATIIAAVYLAVVLLLGVGGEPGTDTPLWQADLFILVSAALLVLIIGGSTYKSIALAQGGGHAVAQMLGGRQVPRASDEPAEQRLLNVVDEMAIASGVPVPAVYVLDDEPAINAFAAGTHSHNAVVAVTRGTLDRLSRDELQGVVAHEFSHILNGDMRLNIRLIGVLHGLLLLTLLGRILMRGSGSSRNAAGAAVLGLVLVVLGYLGVLFGSLIKAAVSRQREYLADASAVQFTRNPAGIAGALKKIGGFGSRVTHPRAEEASHMFFGEGWGGLSSLFATHPPLELRIRRLDPAFNPALAAQMRAHGGSEAAAGAAAFAGADSGLDANALAASAGVLDAAHLAYARKILAGLPDELREGLHRPADARLAIYALLLAPEKDVAAAQLERLEQREPGLRRRVRECAAQLRAAGPAARLPVADLALPALGELDPRARESFLDTVDRLIEADGRVQLFEYTLRTVLRRALGTGPARIRSARANAASLRDAVSLLLSLLVRTGSANEEAARAAFAEAARRAPIEGLSHVAPRRLPLDILNRALEHLASVPPRFKRGLVAACAAAVIHDGRISVSEAELLRAICEALECPMPPLLPGPADRLATGEEVSATESA